ncbi:hypothetical protein [Salirhabdus sp. Marseille-P4669]|uniref:hypothetical protein n=1 Tax=Salirhabdus sp. Marseille-P4669 TaxID=2042310 RepID=UPI000C7E2C40|nr:hypothetical protein [Salirhabdus sp. Marseille-P4669]
MNTFLGKMIEAEYDASDSEFTLKQVKNLETESTISFSHLHVLLDYLHHQLSQNEECVLTLNDQMPVRLSQREIQLLIDDFQGIQTKFDII